jgi:Tfp pilus assembly protein PilN
MMRANFIPAYRLAARSRRRRIRGWAIVCGGYGAAILIAYLTCLAVWGADGKDRTQELQKVSGEISRARQTIARLQRQVSEAESELQANRAVGSQPGWGDLLAVVSADLGDDAVLRRCLLSPADEEPAGEPPAGAAGESNRIHTAAQRPYVLKLGGYARSHAAVSQYVLRLEQGGLFDQIRVVKTAREPLLTGSAIGFQLECALGKEVAVHP